MIFTAIKRWMNRSKSRTQRSTDGTENMFVVPVAAAGAPIHPTESDTDDTEAVEGKSDDSSITEDPSGGEATCGASCGTAT